MAMTPSPPIPVQIRRRGELLGIFSGLACFPFALFGDSLGRLMPSGPAGVVLPMVIFSALAGGMAVYLTSVNEAEDGLAFAPRVGIRAGMVATMTGGAVTVLAATFQVAGIGQPAAAQGFFLILAMLPAAMPFQVLCIVLFGILPSLFFGTIGALAGTFFCVHEAPRPSGKIVGAGTPLPRTRLFTGALIISILGYLSPCAAPFLVALRRPAASPEETPVADRHDNVPSNGSQIIARSESFPIPPSETPTPVYQAPTPEQSAPPISSTTPDVGGALLSFLIAHHQKSTRGDVDSLVADYADRVDHFNHGMVDREFIRKDELEYHSPGTRVTETLISRPVFTQISPNLYSATYSITFSRTHANGHWASGNSDIDMQIALTPAGPRIVSQHSQTRDLHKGP